MTSNKSAIDSPPDDIYNRDARLFARQSQHTGDSSANLNGQVLLSSLTGTSPVVESASLQTAPNSRELENRERSDTYAQKNITPPQVAWENGQVSAGGDFDRKVPIRAQPYGSANPTRGRIGSGRPRSSSSNNVQIHTSPTHNGSRRPLSSREPFLVPSSSNGSKTIHNRDQMLPPSSASEDGGGYNGDFPKNRDKSGDSAQSKSGSLEPNRRNGGNSKPITRVFGAPFISLLFGGSRHRNAKGNKRRLFTKPSSVPLWARARQRYFTGSFQCSLAATPKWYQVLSLVAVLGFLVWEFALLNEQSNSLLSGTAQLTSSEQRETVQSMGGIETNSDTHANTWRSQDVNDQEALGKSEMGNGGNFASNLPAFFPSSNRRISVLAGGSHLFVERDFVNLLQLLHFSFWTNYLWPAAYQRELDAMTLSERFGLALLAAALGALAFLGVVLCKKITAYVYLIMYRVQQRQSEESAKWLEQKKWEIATQFSSPSFVSSTAEGQSHSTIPPALRDSSTTAATLLGAFGSGASSMEAASGLPEVPQKLNLTGLIEWIPLIYDDKNKDPDSHTTDGFDDPSSPALKQNTSSFLEHEESASVPRDQRPTIQTSKGKFINMFFVALILIESAVSLRILLSRWMEITASNLDVYNCPTRSSSVSEGDSQSSWSESPAEASWLEAFGLASVDGVELGEERSIVGGDSSIETSRKLGGTVPLQKESEVGKRAAVPDAHNKKKSRHKDRQFLSSHLRHVYCTTFWGPIVGTISSHLTFQLYLFWYVAMGWWVRSYALAAVLAVLRRLFFNGDLSVRRICGLRWYFVTFCTARFFINLLTVASGWWYQMMVESAPSAYTLGIFGNIFWFLNVEATEAFLFSWDLSRGETNGSGTAKYTTDMGLSFVLLSGLVCLVVKGSVNHAVGRDKREGFRYSSIKRIKVFKSEPQQGHSSSADAINSTTESLDFDETVAFENPPQLSSPNPLHDQQTNEMPPCSDISDIRKSKVKITSSQKAHEVRYGPAFSRVFCAAIAIAGVLKCLGIAFVSFLVVLSFVFGVHVIELILLWLMTFILCMWVPAAIDSFSVDAFALAGFTAFHLSRVYYKPWRSGSDVIHALEAGAIVMVAMTTVSVLYLTLHTITLWLSFTRKRSVARIRYSAAVAGSQLSTKILRLFSRSHSDSDKSSKNRPSASAASVASSRFSLQAVSTNITYGLPEKHTYTAQGLVVVFFLSALNFQSFVATLARILASTLRTFGLVFSEVGALVVRKVQLASLTEHRLVKTAIAMATQLFSFSSLPTPVTQNDSPTAESNVFNGDAHSSQSATSERDEATQSNKEKANADKERSIHRAEADYSSIASSNFIKPSLVDGQREKLLPALEGVDAMANALENVADSIMTPTVDNVKDNADALIRPTNQFIENIDIKGAEPTPTTFQPSPRLHQHQISHLVQSAFGKLTDSPLRTNESFIVYVVLATTLTLLACHLNSFLSRLTKSALDSRSTPNMLRIARDGTGGQGSDQSLSDASETSGKNDLNGQQNQKSWANDPFFSDRAFGGLDPSSSSPAEGPTIPLRFSGAGAAARDRTSGDIYLIEDSFFDYCAHRHHVIVTSGLLHRKLSHAAALVAVAAVGVFAAEMVSAVVRTVTTSSSSSSFAIPSDSFQEQYFAFATTSPSSHRHRSDYRNAKREQDTENKNERMTSRTSATFSVGEEKEKEEATPHAKTNYSRGTTKIFLKNSFSRSDAKQNGDGSANGNRETEKAKERSVRWRGGSDRIESDERADAQRAKFRRTGNELESKESLERDSAALTMENLVRFLMRPSSTLLTTISLIAGFVAIGATFEKIPWIYIFILRAFGLVGGGVGVGLPNALSSDSGQRGQGKK